MNVKTFLFPLLVIMIVASCKKKEGCTDHLATNYNAEAVVENGSCEYASVDQYHLTVQSPKADSVFGISDTIHIKAEISSEDEIHGYSLELWSNSLDSLIFRSQHHVHSNPVLIDTFWIGNQTTAEEMTLILTAIVNHEGLQVSDTVNFSCR